MNCVKTNTGNTISSVMFLTLIVLTMSSQPAMAVFNLGSSFSTALWSTNLKGGSKLPDGGGIITPPDPLPPETNPYAPGVNVMWKTSDSARINWRDKSSVEYGFKVEQQESGGIWDLLKNYPRMYGSHSSGKHIAVGLKPNTPYCFRVTAFNGHGNSDLSPQAIWCTHTTLPGSCSGEAIENILELAHADPDDWSSDQIHMKCNVSFERNQTITKRLVFAGSQSSDITVDLNGATLVGNGTSYNSGKDMIEIRSSELRNMVPVSAHKDDAVLVIDKDQSFSYTDGRSGEIVNTRDGGTFSYTDKLSTYVRPENITIKNGNVRGSIRIWGMAQNGQGDAETTKEANNYAYQCPLQTNKEWSSTGKIKCEIPKSNQFKKSSHKLGHTERARMNAPTNITLENLKITGNGRNPLYFGPGVTDSRLVDSEINGKSNAVGIYLDTESSGITIKGNSIHVGTEGGLLVASPQIGIDGSSNNTIVNNRLSNLDSGGIYLYRNCGEGGVVRHSTPSRNSIINNIFYYDKYDGDSASVYLSSRNWTGIYWSEYKYCEEDKGYPFGSSISNADHATRNAVMQNQIYKRYAYDMIKTKNASVNKPNFVANNTTVTKDTVIEVRRAGCYVDHNNKGFISHGDSAEILDGKCKGYRYSCDDGELDATSVSKTRLNSGACVTITAPPFNWGLRSTYRGFSF